MRWRRPYAVLALSAAVASVVVFACVGSEPRGVVVINASDGASVDGGSNTADGGDATSIPPEELDGTVTVEPTCPDLDAGATFAFVTALEMKGGFGGERGADGRCELAARDGGLCGTYRAWIGSSESSPATRIIEPGSTRRILLVGAGEQLVLRAESLASGRLEHPIDRNQRGTRIDTTSSQVWTGTWGDGGSAPDASCSDWQASAGPGAGLIGNALSGDRSWTEASFKECGGTARLYCFQVP